MRDREFSDYLFPGALEEYLLQCSDQQYTSASDVVECFCFRVCYRMSLEYVRVTYSPTHLYVTDSRHGGSVFYVATPEFLRDFQRVISRTLPSPIHSHRRYNAIELVQALRAAVKAPGATAANRGAA